MCNMENEIIRIKVAPSAVDSDKAGNEKEQKNWANDCKNQENQVTDREGNSDTFCCCCQNTSSNFLFSINWIADDAYLGLHLL